MNKQYAKGKETYTLVKVNETQNATFYMLRREDGSTFTVGSAILKKEFKEKK